MDMKEPALPGQVSAQLDHPLRQRVERLLVELHNEDRLSEGQCAKVLGIDRITWRKIVDEAALEDPAAVRTHDRAAFDVDGAGLPVMPTNISHVLQRIRRSENDIAAQIVLENFAREYARYALHAAAKSDERAALLSERHIRDIAAVWARDPHHFEFEASDFIECAYALVRAAAQKAGATHIRALLYLDRQLSEYLEGVPAEEAIRTLRDVARGALCGINPVSVAAAMGAPGAETVARLFNKHGGPVQDEGWCLNESGLKDFLRDLFAPPKTVPATAAAQDDRIGESTDVDLLLNALAGPKPDCWCETCRPITLADMRMVLCPTCGNKRCPHATDHRNECTGSNEPGQPGSSYPLPAGYPK
ncbi:hypothetical protein [Burkholderia gladioli]|uniref:hypothetical protein n=1 Tax=Burkholderia gladioli TaxID=28095 RepID=UPI001ABB5B0F|nr:hypothetical protein [Burkholderia gladioli]